jgi:hypothetical protein
VAPWNPPPTAIQSEAFCARVSVNMKTYCFPNDRYPVNSGHKDGAATPEATSPRNESRMPKGQFTNGDSLWVLCTFWVNAGIVHNENGTGVTNRTSIPTLNLPTVMAFG